jgi:GNAT superfamily N-acetyltransferase
MNGRIRAPADIVIEEFTGQRNELRFLFELAEDSAKQLDAYIDSGLVLVARDPTAIVGHLQLIPGPSATESEVKNMAVLPAYQRRGIGSSLLRAAIDLAGADGSVRLVVATAAADTDNLRFYQLCGFRMRTVERDAFTPAEGYQQGTLSDGIELRDRVWLDRPLPG